MLNIRKAIAKDAKEIQKILNVSWFTTYKNIFNEEELDILTSKWHDLDKISDQIMGNEYIYLVAEKNTKIVGVCGAYLKEDNVLNIEKLHVLPEYKGLGIGSELLDNILQSFKSVKLLELEVVRQNTSAIIFYEKKGFVKSKEMEFEVRGVKVPCYLMEKHL